MTSLLRAMMNKLVWGVHYLLREAHVLNLHAANGMAKEKPMNAVDFAMKDVFLSYLNGKF